MKPYGREKKIKGSGIWKRDYHIHDINHHKIGNWWEEMCTFLTRGRMKQIFRNKLDELVLTKNGDNEKDDDVNSVTTCY